MTYHDDLHRRYDDILEADAEPAVVRLAATLDRVCRPTPAPRAAHLDAALDRMLQPVTSPAPIAMPRRRPFTGTRLRIASLAAAAALAAGGVAAYLHPQSPAPVSAQTVLSRAAAAARLTPNQAAHLTYTVTASDAAIAGDQAKAGPHTGSADIWLQAGPDGTTAESAQTLTFAGPGQSADPAASSRYVQIGAQSFAYDPGHDAILIAPETRGAPSWLAPADVFNSTSITQELSVLAERSPQRVQLLTSQTLDGNSVVVVEVDGWTDRPAQRTIFYFDAQSYLLRGFDAASDDPSYPTPSWQGRLASYQTMPAGAVPAGAFVLNAPASARIQLPSPDLATFATVCHSNANPKDILKSGQSLLAACRATAPSVTADELIAALGAPAKAALDAAVTDGQITPAQEATALAQQRTQLATLISGQDGQGQ